MGARHFTELAAWRFANDLSQFVHEITGRGTVWRAFTFRDEIREAADSAADNIAEGFGRYGHREFSRFLTISLGSLDETESRLIGGFRKGYFTDQQVNDGRRKVIRTRTAIKGLKRYLDDTDAPPRSA